MKKCKNTACEQKIDERRTYCSLKCRNVYVNTHLRDYSHIQEKAKLNRQKKEIEYALNPRYCTQCFKILPIDKNGKFCNHACSATFNNKTRIILNRNKLSDEALLNIRLSNAKRSNISEHDYRSNPKSCEICGRNIDYLHRENKCCSRECSGKLISIKSKNNPNCGGETNYRKFKYNDIWMDSSWEVVLAEFLDVNSIIWIRDKKIHFKWIDPSGRSRRYHPDFYLPEYDIYLDTKNKYLIEKDRYKIDYVENHSNITILMGSVEYIQNELKENYQI